MSEISIPFRKFLDPRLRLLCFRLIPARLLESLKVDFLEVFSFDRQLFILPEEVCDLLIVVTIRTGSVLRGEVILAIWSRTAAAL
jgi:hypothetical protein